MAPDTHPRFWKSLLFKRREALWGNFTWLSIGVLLQSANDQVSKVIDPTIVNRKRMRIVASQRAQGINANQPIELKGAEQILLLGDPGEMDASQYVLLRELYATQADTLILMSDVVYPAGNVNAWRDAVYLPYYGFPRWDWKSAVDDWANAQGDGPADAPPKIPDWRIFATPGNHDWYDGLDGFMFNACGAEPLANVLFSNEGLTRQQRISRALWQRARRPDRSKLEPLRMESERQRSAAQEYHAEDAFELGDVASVGAVPRQPGPYFAIDVPVGEHRVRLVSVDTGVDGSIDVEQAIWLEAQLHDKTVPKIVITGKPLAVDQKIGRFPIDGGPWMEPLEETNESIDGDKVDEDHVDLRDLLSNGDAVIATVAGDIHNYQRMVLRGDGTTPQRAAAERQRVMYLGNDGLTVALPQAPGLPPLQIVAGGGGAYLTETHKVTFDQADRLELRDERNEEHITVPRDYHTRYPSREESVLLFGKNVRPGTSGWILGVCGVGAAGAAVLLGELLKGGPATVQVGEFFVPTWRLVLGAFGTVGMALLLAFLAMVRTSRIPSFFRSKSFVAALAISAVAFGFGWWTPVDGVPLLLGGALLAIAIPLPLVALPLLRAYPSLRRLLPTRTLFAGMIALLSYLAAQRDDLALLLLLALVGVLFAYWLLKKFLGRYQHAARGWAIEERKEFLRLILVVLSLCLPLLVLGAAIYLGSRVLEADERDAVLIIAATDLLLAMTAAVGFAGGAIWKARRTSPTAFAIVIAVAAGGAFLGSLVVESGFGSDFWACVSEGAIASYFAAAAGLTVAGVGFGLLGRTLPNATEVTAALKARDLKEASTSKSIRLFRIVAISNLPGLGQLAESTHAPFYKNFLTLKIAETGEENGGPGLKLDFIAFGLKDERPRDAAPYDHPASQEPTERGSYEVDRVSIVIPDTAGAGLPPGPVMNPGDIILTGIHAQAVLSRAIKLGSVLRFQPVVARVATATLLGFLAASVAAAIVLDWSLLGAAAAFVVAFLAGVVAVWVIATIGLRKDAFWARYSHAALVTQVDPDGTVWVTEALARGIKKRRMKYPVDDYRHIPVPMTDEDREQVLEFARAVVDAKTRYGVVLFASLAVYCITVSIPGPTLVLAESGTAICSGFVSDALTRTGIIWHREPYWQMPADIAAYFEVR
jgi:MFS family permease